MFTQLNQYHVVLEVKPNFDQHPLELRDLYIRSGMAGASASSGGVSGGSSHECVPGAFEQRPRSIDIFRPPHPEPADHRPCNRAPRLRQPHFPTAARCR